MGEQEKSPAAKHKGIRLSKVQDMVGGVNRSTIWRWERAGLFPKSFSIGPNIRAWDEAEIHAWMAARKEGQLK